MDVRVNPLITFVWVGFGLLMLGTAVATFGRRKATQHEDGEVPEAERLPGPEAGSEAAAEPAAGSERAIGPEAQPAAGPAVGEA